MLQIFRILCIALFVLFFSSFVLLGQDTKVNKTLRTLLSDLPVVYQNEVRGGYHTATNLLSPSGDIATSRKEVGMLAWDVASAMHYQWDGSAWRAVFLLKNWEPGSAKSGQLYLKDTQIYRSLQDNTVTGTTDPATDALNWVLVGGTKVIDDLTSTSTVDALSANQGRVLNSKIEDNIAAIEDNANAIALRPLGSTKGELQYWDGSAWVLLEPTTKNGSELRMVDLVPVWVSVPGAPTGVVAVAGDGDAVISFTAPSSNGGLDIISYTAVSDPGGFTGTVSQSGSGKIIVRGLANGTAYTFRVKAISHVGESLYSEASSSVMPSDPVPSVGGKIWMDRNLGATRVAESATDVAAYGDLYQWGRETDGHEKRNSLTRSGKATSATNIGHGDFLIGSANWLNTADGSLWDGANAPSNPCPPGYRIPTDAEWQAEISAWTSSNSSGAFDSSLKLVLTGARNSYTGGIGNQGVKGFYWVNSTYSENGARALEITESDATITGFFKATGAAVRCIKDD